MIVLRGEVTDVEIEMFISTNLAIGFVSMCQNMPKLLENQQYIFMNIFRFFVRQSRA